MISPSGIHRQTVRKCAAGIYTELPGGGLILHGVLLKFSFWALTDPPLSSRWTLWALSPPERRGLSFPSHGGDIPAQARAARLRQVRGGSLRYHTKAIYSNLSSRSLSKHDLLPLQNPVPNFSQHLIDIFKNRLLFKPYHLNPVRLNSYLTPFVILHFEIMISAIQFNYQL